MAETTLPTQPASSDALLIALGDALPQPGLVARLADGRVLFENQALRSVLGHDKPYLVGDRWHSLLSASTIESLVNTLTAQGHAAQVATLRVDEGVQQRVVLTAGLVPLGSEALVVLTISPLLSSPGWRLPGHFDVLKEALWSQLDGPQRQVLQDLQALLTRSP